MMASRATITGMTTPRAMGNADDFLPSWDGDEEVEVAEDDVDVAEEEAPEALLEDEPPLQYTSAVSRRWGVLITTERTCRKMSHSQQRLLEKRHPLRM
jgi:hypothetical protein